MPPKHYLIDNSAFVRLRRLGLTEWDDRLDAGLVSVCAYTELEVLYSARSFEEYEATCRWLRTAFIWVPDPDCAAARACEVQRELVRAGKHRGPGPMDLLIAATAEFHSLTVLHYDADYDAIASVTGQPTEWIAPRGSVS